MRRKILRKVLFFKKHRMRCGNNKQRNASARVDAAPWRRCFGSRKLLNHANEVSETLEFLPQREERADIGKDDVVEARKWIPDTPYIINTRARRCACILYYLATVKASYRVSVSLNSRRRLFWWIYPPKLSNMIMSSSTPSEWSKSSTVFDIIGGPQR